MKTRGLLSIAVLAVLSVAGTGRATWTGTHEKFITTTTNVLGDAAWTNFTTIPNR